MRQSTNLAKMYKIVLSNYQLYMGYEQLFLNQPINHCGQLINGRVTFLWKFSRENNITFDLPTIWRPTMLRVNDKCIMDIINITIMTRTELLAINACRLYLQVITISDIVDATGKFLVSTYYRPPLHYKSRSTFKWPYQPRPSESEWYYWRRMIRDYLCINETLVLRHPLGPWKQTDSHLQHEYMYDTNNECLINMENGMTHSLQGCERFNSTPDNIPSTSNRCLVPATTFSTPTSIFAAIGKISPSKESILQRPVLIREKIFQLPSQYNHHILHLSVTNDNGYKLVQSLRHGKLMACSDGSVKNGKGTYGFVITNETNDSYIHGYGFVPPSWDKDTSQRVEYFGGLAIVTVLKILCDHYTVTNAPTVTIRMDNEGVVDFNASPINSNGGIKEHCQQDYDVRASTKFIESSLPFHVNWEWVPSHQDKYKNENILMPMERLNIQSDK